MADRTRTLCCAIYTRKSSEEGLEQEFNSLDAQREACEAYVLSQRHEGWVPLPDRYDDGGFSGGTMDRPGLKQLLADITLGKVDVVVVYKVDRLTRALADFAKIVDAFDGKGVSFVSVTQQFNTTTSMGRLTLNVLLSFAQFEREVTGERIRDKIAASKKKGMWMGGFVPLGYEARDRKLHIVEEEAQIVRELFRLYLNLGNVAAVKREADRRGYLTKRREHVSERWRGGVKIFHGHLYQLLHNPIYAGYIGHKGDIFEGEHTAIVDREDWQSVQKLLDSRNMRKDPRTTAKHPSMLAGMIFDADGVRLSPCHANKNGRRYRYYVSRDIIQHGIKQRGWRIPAAELEGATKRSLTSLLTDEARLIDELAFNGTVATKAGIAAANALSCRIDRALLIELDTSISLHERGLALSIDRQKLRGALVPSQGTEIDGRIDFEVPLEVCRRGVEMKLVIGAGSNDVALVDPTLVRTIARGRTWFEELLSGAAPSISEIARREGVTMRYVALHIDLAFLSPTITEAILQGRQPVDMTSQSLKQLDLPVDWTKQAALLGF